jgi:predicted CoA-binding protein
MVLTNSFKKGVKKVWFQPGTESEKAIRFCEENGIEHNEPGTCILMERRNRERQMK